MFKIKSNWQPFFIDYLVGFCTSLDGWPGIAGSLRPHPSIHEDDQRSGSGCILAVFLDQERSIDFQYDRNKITRLDVILLHINIYVKILDPIFEKGVLGPKSHNFGHRQFFCFCM